MDNSLAISDIELKDVVSGQEESKPGRIERVIMTIKEFATLAEVLRVFGALIMVASMSVFLLQGWSDGNDVQRYLKLLAQTGLLAAGGFGLSYLLKEYRGARLFFGLGLLSVPVNFTVLGALIYSLFLSGGASPIYPGYAKWVITDAFSTGLVFSAAMLVLIPVTALGFRIMARNSSKVLTLTFLGLNALLVIPTRAPLMIGLMSSVALLLVVHTHFRQRKENPVLSTPSGVFATALLYFPIALLVARNMMIYGLSLPLGLIVCLSVYWVLRKLSEGDSMHSLKSMSLDLISFFVAIGVAMLATLNWLEFADAFPIQGWRIESSIANTLFCGVFLLYMVDKKLFSGSSKVNKVTVPLAAIISAVVASYAAVLIDIALSSILSGLVGASLAYFGFKHRSRLIAAAGLITIAVASTAGLHEIVELLFQSSWIGLAVLGGIAIISASLVDRYGAVIKLRVSNWHKLEKRTETSDTVQ